MYLPIKHNNNNTDSKKTKNMIKTFEKKYGISKTDARKTCIRTMYINKQGNKRAKVVCVEIGNTVNYQEYKIRLDWVGMTIH